MLGFANETITRIRPVEIEDSRHNKILDPEGGDELEIYGCSVQPGATAEEERFRDTVTIRYTIFAPYTADIEAFDLVKYAGRTFQVHGNPARWSSPTGAVSHTQISLVDWEG